MVLNYSDDSASLSGCDFTVSFITELSFCCLDVADYLSGRCKNKEDEDKINSFCEYMVFVNN